MSEPQAPQPPEEKKESSPASKFTTWIVGGVLILVGVVFIIGNVTGFQFRNWWALFILIPAFGSLGTAYSMFKKNGGRFTAASRGPLVGGLILLFITAIFIFDLNWGAMWPVLLIIAGVGLLLTALDRK